MAGGMAGEGAGAAAPASSLSPATKGRNGDDKGGSSSDGGGGDNILLSPVERGKAFLEIVSRQQVQDGGGALSAKHAALRQAGLGSLDDMQRLVDESSSTDLMVRCISEFSFSAREVKVFRGAFMERAKHLRAKGSGGRGEGGEGGEGGGNAGGASSGAPVGGGRAAKRPTTLNEILDSMGIRAGVDPNENVGRY